MFRRFLIVHFAIPWLSVSGVEEVVNLLQTTVQKQLVSSHSLATKKKCVIKGDPHANTWDQTDEDGAKLGIYGTYADYWMIKTEQLQLMGRVGGVEEFDMGVVKGIAVAGPLMENQTLTIPTINAGPITYGDDVIGPDDFPWTSPGGTVTIEHGTIPNYNLFGGKNGMNPRENGYTIKMGTKVEIQLNQDTFQHFMVLADADVIADDEGLCNHECKNWFRCQNPICNLKHSLFTIPHPECGHVIVRVPCNKLRLKLANQWCEKKFEGSNPYGAAIQNCIEDCCSDRDQCPDRGKGDGMETCLVFGDPHIKGFDAKAPSLNTFSPMGVHYLVRSDFIKVQASYESGPSVKAQVEGLAITGPIVSDAKSDGSHSIIHLLPRRDGGVSVDGKMVMTCLEAEDCSDAENFYEDPKGQFNISFGPGDDIPALVGEKRPVPTRKNTHIVRFKEGATIMAHQGTGQAIYMHIPSAVLDGVSGECGNMNGNPDDDNHDDYDQANSFCALKEEIFIPNGQVCTHIVPLKTCFRKKELAPFRNKCRKQFNLPKRVKKMTFAERMLLKDCMVDCCRLGSCPDPTGEDY